MRPDQVESLLERYHVLDARVCNEERVVRRRRRFNCDSLEIRAAVVRVDIDRALMLLRQLDEHLWRVIKIVHVIPYPDRSHPDYQEDKHWFAHHQGRLQYSLTTRRQMAALDLGLSTTTIRRRCTQAYRHMADWLA